MVNQEYIDLLRQGSNSWNVWRKQHKEVQPDLSGANLSNANLTFANLSRANLSGARLSGANLSNANLGGANLSGVNLSNARLNGANLIGANLSGQDLSKANLSGANLSKANLSDANLSGARLSRADLSDANLSDANLSGANLSDANLSGTNLSGQDLSNKNLSGSDLSGADLSGTNLSGQDLSNKNLSDANLSDANLTHVNLSEADLSRARLSGANLSRATLVGTNLADTKLKDCTIYGIAAWDVRLNGAEQINLTITPRNQPTITVDNLKIAQFIYLLLNNAEIRDVIETLTTKSVLILGRFTPERKAILDALREALRKHNYLPILFDFDQPSTQTVRETVRTLAHLSHFIIADLTEPSSVPLELETIIPTLPIAVQPILAASEKREFSMFSSLSIRYLWVLPTYRYTDLASLLVTLDEKVLAPAEQKAQELALVLRKE